MSVNKCGPGLTRSFSKARSQRRCRNRIAKQPFWFKPQVVVACCTSEVFLLPRETEVVGGSRGTQCRLWRNRFWPNKFDRLWPTLIDRLWPKFGWPTLAKPTLASEGWGPEGCPERHRKSETKRRRDVSRFILHLPTQDQCCLVGFRCLHQMMNPFNQHWDVAHLGGQ